jgi:hypothetical protein
VVERPPSGIRGYPFGAPPYRVQDVGYTVEEFFVSGVAKTYTSPQTIAPYRTRVVIVRPAGRTPFNGTVIAEWENVTGNLPAAIDFIWLHPYLLANGYAYAMVSAQKTGVDFLRAWDPTRYGSLVHPGDNYSLDIYSQVMAAIRHPQRLAPLGPLRVKKAIAIGQSQSARWLYFYVTLAQNDARVFDGIISDADIEVTFGDHTWNYPDLQVPFIQFNSEDTQPDIEAVANPTWYRRYDVVGASHVDADQNNATAPGLRSTVFAPQPYPYTQDEAWYKTNHYGEEGPSASATCVSGNEFPRRYALDAAVDAMNKWLTNGVPAPPSVQAEFDAVGRPVTDAYGNRKGGWRLPPIDVPVATYEGVAQECTVQDLSGRTAPLPPTTLAQLYPNHQDYVAKMQAATDAAVAERWMLPGDAEELMTKARASKIPSWF